MVLRLISPKVLGYKTTNTESSVAVIAKFLGRQEAKLVERETDAREMQHSNTGSLVWSQISIDQL